MRRPDEHGLCEGPTPEAEYDVERGATHHDCVDARDEIRIPVFLSATGGQEIESTVATRDEAVNARPDEGRTRHLPRIPDVTHVWHTMTEEQSSGASARARRACIARWLPHRRGGDHRVEPGAECAARGLPRHRFSSRVR